MKRTNIYYRLSGNAAYRGTGQVDVLALTDYIFELTEKVEKMEAELEKLREELRSEEKA